MRSRSRATSSWPEAGTYRFWISSDDEGSLLLAINGDPASATRVAWLTNFTTPLNWTADASQRSATIDLAAGQTIWIEAYNRDAGGGDHLQVAWSRAETDPEGDPTLIPAEVLSENAPVEDALPASPLGPIEGQQSASGSFVSAAIDATPGGSNVFGLFQLQSTGDVAIDVSFANDPAGPWTAPIALVADAPAPLSADTVRYVRFSGVLTDDTVDPAVTLIGVQRDLAEAVSVDAATTVSVPGAGDHVVLRVRGSIGSPGTASIGTSSSGAVAFTLSTDDANDLTEVPFGSSSHHIVVGAAPGPATATATWSVTDGLGAVILHDIVVSVDGS